MEKVVFVSFEFHPVQSTGNFRIAKFIKYFRTNGIEPVVVCGTVDAILSYFPNRVTDYSLCKELPIDLEIYRLPLNNPIPPKTKFNQFFTPVDSLNYSWGKSLNDWANLYFLKNENITKIFFSCPPFSISKTIIEIVKRNDLKLIVDFRDAWAQQAQHP